jgi:hypothetical protein
VLYGMGGHVSERMTSLVPAHSAAVTETTKRSANLFAIILATLNIGTLPRAMLEEAKECGCELKGQSRRAQSRPSFPW